MCQDRFSCSLSMAFTTIVVVDDEAVANLLSRHAGLQNRSKRQATTLQKAESSKGCLKPKQSPLKAEPWGASLLKVLPQPFKDLAVRWGFAPSDKQQLAATSLPASPLPASLASRRQQDSPTEWTHESPAQKPLELQLCLSLTSSSVGAAGQTQSATRSCSLQAADMGSCGVSDKESFSRLPAQTTGDATRPKTNWQRMPGFSMSNAVNTGLHRSSSWLDCMRWLFYTRVLGTYHQKRLAVQGTHQKKHTSLSSLPLERLQAMRVPQKLQLLRGGP